MEDLKIINKTYTLNYDKIQTVDDIKNILMVLQPVLNIAEFPDFANKDLWIENKNE